MADLVKAFEQALKRRICIEWGFDRHSPFGTHHRVKQELRDIYNRMDRVERHSADRYEEILLREINKAGRGRRDFDGVKGAYCEGFVQGMFWEKGYAGVEVWI